MDENTALATNESKALEVINPAIAKAAESAGIMQAIGQEVGLLPTDEEFRYKLPRLGKVRIGIKVETQNNRSYPKAVDYFVLPEALLNDKDFIQALTDRGVDPEKPKALPIMLLRNGIGEDIVSSYDLYGSSKGLICRSYDHVTCQRVNSKTLEMETVPCAGINCPDWNSKKCRCITRIRFLLPDAIGIGVWQLDTSSVNSRTSILTELMSIKQAFGGKLAGIDLLLTLEPQVYHIPQTERDGTPKRDAQGNTSMMATTAHIVHVRSAISMRKAQEAIKNAHEFDGAESVDMSLDEEEVIQVDETTGEVIENQANTTNTKQDTSIKPEVVESQSASDPLATSEQLTELKNLWAMQFLDDNKAGNAWAKGMLGKSFNAKDLTETEATMLIAELEKCLTPPEEEPIDAEYEEYSGDLEMKG